MRPCSPDPVPPRSATSLADLLCWQRISGNEGTGKTTQPGAYLQQAQAKDLDDRRAHRLPTDRAPGGGAGRAHVSIVPLLAQSAFDPEFIETLVSAYEDAWQKIEKSGSAFASPRYRRAAQEIVAKRIIETAQRGEREPKQLADDAVAYLAQSYA